MTVEEIFLTALDQPDAPARETFLETACGGDADLRHRVDDLLAAHFRSGEFLHVSASGEKTVTLQGDDASTDDMEGLHFLTPSTRPDSLGRIGHYEVLQVLGKGGFGIVFRAFDDVLQRVVAVKMMAPQLAVTSPARKRFLREARSSAAVRHENVVQVYEVVEQPLPYLVMEFIPGGTLQELLNRTGPLDVKETLRIGRQIAEGLAAAHATDLIHRDIKPSNILIEGGQNRVKITDFGLARAADDASISQSGIIAGTPMYMAPEQAQGQPLDQRADLFSLGSVLYQMASGRPPFRANSTVAVLKRVAEETPRSIREIIPETPQWLCGIIAKLHAKNPEDRFQTAREVADVLGDCETQLRNGAKLTDFSRIPQVAAKRGGRWKMVAALVAVVGLAASLAPWASRYYQGKADVRFALTPGFTVMRLTEDGLAVKEWTPPDGGEYMLPPGRYKIEPQLAPGWTAESWEITTHGLMSFQLTTHGVHSPEFEVARGERVIIRSFTRQVPGGGPTPSQTTSEWVQLFNGKDLTGWKSNPEQPGTWNVSDGVIIGTTSQSHLFTERADFANFHLRAEMKLNKGGDSGIRFRAPFQLLRGPQPWQVLPAGGYEAEFTKLNVASVATGSVWRVNREGPPNPLFQAADPTLPRPDVWCVYEVIADGNRIITKLDGKKMANCADPESMYTKGHIALQCFSAETYVQFRKIEIRELPAGDSAAPEPRTVASAPDRRAAEYVLSIGGTVSVNDGNPAIKTMAELPKVPFRLTTVDLRGNTKVDDGALSVFAECKNLLSLRLDQTPTSDAGLAHFAGCKGLMDISLHSTDAGDKGMIHFAGCKNLRILYLSSTKVTDAGLVHFANCKKLTALGLHNTTVGDEGLVHFGGCKELKELYLNNTKATDKGMHLFSGCKDLARLSLSFTPVGDMGLACFAKCGNLARLMLENTSVTDDSASVLRGFPLLSSAMLKGTRMTPNGILELSKLLPNCRITHDGGVIAAQPGVDRKAAEWVLSIGGRVRINAEQRWIQAPADLPGDAFRLAVVDLVDNKRVTDDALAILEACVHLTQLWLSTTNVGDDGLAHFKDCENLTLLNLGGTRTSDAGLANFEKCKGLTHLYLAGTKVGDQGLARFKECRKLVLLNLADAEITDASVSAIRGFGGLQTLHVNRTKMTPAGIAELGRALPQCRIVDNDRMAAEYVLSVGGSLRVGNDAKFITSVAGLPGGLFHLSTVVLDAKSKATDEGLYHLAGCGRLLDLTLHGQLLTDAGLRHFQECKQLKTLNLNLHKATDAGLANFAGIETLLSLTIDGMPITNAGVANFKDCRNLTQLALNGTAVTDAGLANFQDCKNLEHLNLHRSLTTDAGLVNFKDCKKLAYLALSYTVVTDSGLANFADCERLGFLSVHSTKVTEKGLAHFKDLTQLRIVGAKVADLSVLKGMPLKELECDFKPERDAAIIRSIRTLEKINGKPEAEFWERFDKGDLKQLSGPSGTPSPEAKAPDPAAVKSLSDVVAAKQRVLDTTKTRFDAGLVNRMEVLAVEIDLSEARVKLAEAQKHKASMVEQLEGLVKARTEEREQTVKFIQAGRLAANEKNAADARLAEAKARLAKAKAE